jgi:hypothetical protein
MATAPLLDISTIVPQYSILIDGKSYFIRNTDGLSLRQSLIVERAMPRIATLMQADLTEADDRELSGLLQQVCSSVLEAPDDVRDKLTDVQRLQVFIAFTPLRSKLLPPATGAPVADTSLTGAIGSPDSKPAMAGRSRRGSTRSRKG